MLPRRRNRTRRSAPTSATRRTDGGTADDLAKLAGLRDRGVITEADFQQGKDKILKTAA